MVIGKGSRMLLWGKGGFSMKKRLIRICIIMILGLIIFVWKKMRGGRIGLGKFMRELLLMFLLLKRSGTGSDIYIYLWINYALYEELDVEDMDRTREVYRECLKMIPMIFLLKHGGLIVFSLSYIVSHLVLGISSSVTTSSYKSRVTNLSCLPPKLHKSMMHPMLKELFMESHLLKKLHFTLWRLLTRPSRCSLGVN